MSVLYFLSCPPLTSDALLRVPRPEAVEGYRQLPAPLQRSLTFSWQWMNEQASFRIPTSGSTGPPKTIEITRQQMLASIRNTQRALSLTSDHTALLCIDPAYVGGKMVLARALEIGMDVVGVAPTAHLPQNLPRRPDVLALVPLQLQTLVDGDTNLLNDAHVTLVGGAPVSPALEDLVRVRINTPVYSTYGMTETVSHVALRRLNGSEASEAFCVVGDTQLGTDERGCLTLRGAVTNQQLVVTNDQVSLIDQQRFRWLGRYDWVINSGGVKVSPESVERTVAERWTVPLPPPRFLVAGVPDRRLGQRVVLLVEGPPAPAADQQTLLRSVAASVPRYHAPQEIYYLPHFPQTPGGKLDRQKTVAQLVRNTT